MGLFIDRSNNNGVDRLAAAGVSHLYAKLTEGTGFVDSTFLDRRARAGNHGIVFGAYHFAGHASPEAEAAFFLDELASHGGLPAPGQFRPCLDLESGQSAEWASRFLMACEKRLGYMPAIYGSTFAIASLRRQSAVIRSAPWWRAEYSVNDGRRHRLEGGRMGAAAHQYTSLATFRGISGRTDASVLLSPTAMLVPHPKRRRRVTKAAWAYAAWWLGVGPYRGRGRVAWRLGARRAAPPSPRKPRGWKRAVRWYQRHVGGK